MLTPENFSVRMEGKGNPGQVLCLAFFFARSLRPLKAFHETYSW